MTVLDDLIAGAKQRMAVRESQVSFEEIKQRAQAAAPAKDVVEALTGGSGAVSIIAEIKRASPSKGHLASIPNPAELASIYEAGGAAMVSVLTEELRFNGSLEDLASVRQTIDIPVLRKDFIVTPYQVHEARAYGADAVLLIVAALEQTALVSLVERVTSLGMTPLVETHSRLEVFRALDAGARVIGVNARNLKNFHVDNHLVEEIIDAIPADVVAVAESGVSSAEDVMDYAMAGADAVLIGEALVTASSPSDQIREMVSVGQHPALQRDRKKRVRLSREEV